jgi:hypothetical protein
MQYFITLAMSLLFEPLSPALAAPIAEISSGTHLRFIGSRGTCQSTFGFFRQHEHTQTN